MEEELARSIIAALEDVAEATEADLQSAPLLDDWMILGAPGAAYLVGAVHGHPGFQDGSLCRTNVLIALSTSEMWARTASRFYRLGRRLEEARNGH